MKPRIYIETSVISYLVARPSLDAINAARQNHSLQLWLARDQFDLVLSNLVIDESNDGDPQAVVKRQVYLQALGKVPMPMGAVDIANALVASGAMPAKAYADGMHIACAALNHLDLIASWNFRHIASIWAKKKINDCLIQLGVSVPLIATPEDIMESLQ
jgi:hypothetical protein